MRPVVSVKPSSPTASGPIGNKIMNIKHVKKIQQMCIWFIFCRSNVYVVHFFKLFRRPSLVQDLMKSWIIKLSSWYNKNFKRRYLWQFVMKAESHTRMCSAQSLWVTVIIKLMMTRGLNFKTLMTLKMSEEGKGGFGLKKLDNSVIFTKTRMQWESW